MSRTETEMSSNSRQESAESSAEDLTIGSIATPDTYKMSGTPPRVEIPVEKNVFYNEETLKYMRIIDMYKKLGIGKDIELPRIVIAGAQSCGKSSLLENLTGLPVPITTGIGTRFPIEITLIEDIKKFQIRPSIVLDPKSQALSSMQKDKIQKFNLGQVYNEPMTQAEFKALLRNASDLLAVPPPVFARDRFTSHKVFEQLPNQTSSHVLQIEMRGPSFKSLSFVDTPGLYQSGNSEQDITPVDKIESLVTSLIGEKRTIIVAVMEATQSTVSQKIFKFADDVDTTGTRVIGVMTKCDLVSTTDTDALEATLRRARNEERILKHGWYVVKNRSSSEAKAGVSLNSARDSEASLFAGWGWNPIASGVSEKRMGISALRAGLSNVFCSHIRTEFPAFNGQIRNILKQRRSQLADLGPARSSISDQRNYLASIVEAYRIPKSQCLKEDYRPNPNNKIADTALERKLALGKRTEFRDKLKFMGAVWVFHTPIAEKDSWSEIAASAPLDKNTSNIYTWINHRYQQTKSSTLPGLVPYPLVERLFEEQTANWMKITATFVDHIKQIFTATAEHCLSRACANKTVFDALKEILVARINSKLEGFKKHCFSLIQNEQNGLQVIACEQQFIDDLREARTLRFISALAQLEDQCFWKRPTPLFPNPTAGEESGVGSSDIFTSSTVPGTSGESISGGLFRSSNAQPKDPSAQTGFGATQETKSTSIPAEKASPPRPKYTPTNFRTLADFAKENKAKLKEVLTHDRQIVYEIHDILKVYYTTSVQHYIDVVCKNGLNPAFSEETMSIFSKELLDELPDAEISRIAAESPADRKTRRELKEDIERLELAISQSETILREPPVA
ncbi:hypothetical protein BP5796_04527 [Coleophoma crateriformis]|uniref:GED domain-containing protein n=1 Tax=Coleophoma crateriformis TaxID=565419 RepID=A0A3D8S9K4_9HELO|nr:hypothetical protein BP5796_04527 [Coleophoma crateriformis]